MWDNTYFHTPTRSLRVGYWQGPTRVHNFNQTGTVTNQDRVICSDTMLSLAIDELKRERE